MSAAVSSTELAPNLEEACNRWPDRPAITQGPETISYRELWQRVLALAAGYGQLGISIGDRIMCQLPNCTEHIIAMNAAWTVGAIHVAVDLDLTGNEVAALVQRTQAAAYIFKPPRTSDPEAIVRAVRKARPGILVIGHYESAAPTDLIDLGELLDPSPNGRTAAPLAKYDRTRVAILHLTSGTTGQPKIVVDTLEGCWGRMQFFAGGFSPGPTDVHLLYLPISHGFGLRLALLALMRGGRLVLADRFSPAEAMRSLIDEAVTVLPGTPTHFTLLLRALEKDPRRVEALRCAISSAATVPPQLASEMQRELGTSLLLIYGCSEGFLVSTNDEEEIQRGSVGKIVYRGPDGTAPDGSIVVVDPVDHTPLPTGQVGELAFGARRPIRYWDGPDAATDGLYYTGDLGRIEPDGCVFILGRLNDLINRGGLKVSPTEIEKAIAAHPDVGDAAVIAMTDPVLGEAICACIVPATLHSVNLADLRAFLAASLARHKLPDELCCVQSVPRTKVGKVDRSALIALVLRDAQREKLRS